MKKFLIKLLIFVVALFCFFALIIGFDYFIIGGQYKQNYQASLNDKVKRLENINSPKIILVGNSNLSFGIESELIEEKIGMPVVNLGLHGALGNAFHEEIAKLNINTGDIIIVCHTDYKDDDKIGDSELAWITYDYNNNLLPIFRTKDFINIISSYPEYLKDSYSLWITGRGNLDTGDSYSRNAFNKYGDIEIKNKEGQMEYDEFFKSHIASMPQINDTCVSRLNDFNEYCNEKGAELLVAAYPIAFGKYSTFNKHDFEIFQEELSLKLDCKVISNYVDYFYPYSYFYDTVYHLNEIGTKARTLQLITDIEQYLSHS